MLAVDQAEEVFSLCEDLDERAGIPRAPGRGGTSAAGARRVRGDRLAEVTEHAGFSRLVERRPPPRRRPWTRTACARRSRARPSRRAWSSSPAWSTSSCTRCATIPGPCPLLSHALLETWQRREGNTLTVDGYHASGGIHGAVAQSAERLYGRDRRREQRHLLRDLVLRLVSPGAEGEAVRTRVPRRLIATDAEHDQLVEALVAARLVTSDDGVLEITHEALARAWPRLRGWLDDDVEGQRILHHLVGAADAWDTLGRPDSELYRGVRLARALDWQSRTALRPHRDRARVPGRRSRRLARPRSAAPPNTPERRPG